MKTTRTRTEARRSDASVNGQSANLTQLYEVHGSKIRIRIQSDSYRSQCYARAERWDGSQWREVYSLEPAAMKTPDSLAYDRAVIADPERTMVYHCGPDIFSLLSACAEVLEPAQ